MTTSSLFDAKYCLINGILYQKIGVINLNEIKIWTEIKKIIEKDNLISSGKYKIDEQNNFPTTLRQKIEKKFRIFC